jgi:hypothetical protein
MKEHNRVGMRPLYAEGHSVDDCKATAATFNAKQTRQPLDVAAPVCFRARA